MLPQFVQSTLWVYTQNKNQQENRLFDLSRGDEERHAELHKHTETDTLGFPTGGSAS